ncbi:NAD-P-binding protein [Atractiella rhizophila]|nr:NAD-P-binding protein [Atractiella rhizophila]
MSNLKTVLVIGGTGAQGRPMVKHLATSYHVRVLTRSTTSTQAQSLLAYGPNVELIQGDVGDESLLEKALEGAYGAVVNLDGFVLGEMHEVYFGIRIFELAQRAGVQHFVWSAIDYNSLLSGWKKEAASGHMDGKGRVTQFLKSFSPEDIGDRYWTVLGSGPYIDMLTEGLLPTRREDGTYEFAYPLGKTGTLPFIYVEDLGFYAKWILDNPKESSYKHIRTATCHATGEDIAKAFTKVTGKPAVYVEEDPANSSRTANFADIKVGKGQATNTGMTWRQNFDGWWTWWRMDGSVRDYELMDRIHPNRVKSVEEWMRKTNYDGSYTNVLKGQNEGTYLTKS